MNINDNETIFQNIYENIKVRINSVLVLQSLLIIENFSQSLIFRMSYIIITLMIIKSHFFSIIDIKIINLNDKRKIQFQDSKSKSKIKYLSQLFFILEFEQKKD